MLLLERISRIITTAAAVAIAVSVVKISFLRPERSDTPAPEEYVTWKDWRSVLPIGIRVGDSDAPLTILMFADFECPVCARFHSTLQVLNSEFPGAISSVHVHFPLSYHRFAYPAARAAECADRIGAFEAYSSALYLKQDSLGLLSWGELASIAGMSDTNSISICGKNSDRIPRIDAGVEFGKRIGVTGTPTVVVNGHRFTRPPSLDRLRQIARQLLSGDDPFDIR